MKVPGEHYLNRHDFTHYAAPTHDQLAAGECTFRLPSIMMIVQGQGGHFCLLYDLCI